MRDQNLAQMLGERGIREPHSVAFRVRRGERYVDIPWSQVTERMAAIAAGILSAGGDLLVCRSWGFALGEA